MGHERQWRDGIPRRLVHPPVERDRPGETRDDEHLVGRGGCHVRRGGLGDGEARHEGEKSAATQHGGWD